MHSPGQTLRIGFAEGVMPDKWLRRWRQRNPQHTLDAAPLDPASPGLPALSGLSALREQTLDMAFLRLPVDGEDLHVIRLYTEAMVVVVPADHPVTAFDEITLADLASEQLVTDPATVPGWDALDAPARLDWSAMTHAQAVEVVASGSGIHIVPMSIARLHDRKDVASRPVVDLDGPTVGLVWLRGADPEAAALHESFVGVVRGRTERSSRQQAEAAPAKKPAKKAATASGSGRRPTRPGSGRSGPRRSSSPTRTRRPRRRRA